MESPSEKHAALERDIQDLKIEIHGRSAEGKPEREVLRQIVGERLSPLPPLSNQSSNKTSTASQKSVLPSYLASEDPMTRLKVEELVDLALHKGLAEAVKQAKKSAPLVLDGFHDAITDTLYEEFKKRGLLK